MLAPFRKLRTSYMYHVEKQEGKKKCKKTREFDVSLYEIEFFFSDADNPLKFLALLTLHYSIKLQARTKILKKIVQLNRTKPLKCRETSKNSVT